jgi:hypothetical protein
MLSPRVTGQERALVSMANLRRTSSSRSEAVDSPAASCPLLLPDDDGTGVWLCERLLLLAWRAMDGAESDELAVRNESSD